MLNKTISVTLEECYPSGNAPSSVTQSLADEILAALPGCPPRALIRRGLKETSRKAWADYCKARSAFILYSWFPLKEKCICELLCFLVTLNLSFSCQSYVVRRIDDSLSKIMERTATT